MGNSVAGGTRRNPVDNDFTASLISGAQSESGPFEASSAKRNQTAQSRTEGGLAAIGCLLLLRKLAPSLLLVAVTLLRNSFAFV